MLALRPVSYTHLDVYKRQELATVEKEIERAKGKLSNQGFLSKAPAQLVEAEKEKLEANEKKAVSLNERIAELKQSL